MAKICDIPVLLAELFEGKIIGKADIEDNGDLTIKIKGGILVENIEKLVETDQIVGLAVSVAYRDVEAVAPISEETI